MNTTTCKECGQEIHIGDWPLCPHSPVRERDALAFSPPVVWEAVDGSGYQFPGRSDEPVPAGYRPMELNSLRAADKFTAMFNERERERLTAERALEKAYWDDRIKRRRDDVLAKAGQSNERARTLLKAVADLRERKRERKYGQKIEPNFHVSALSFDASNRAPYNGPETGWKDRK